MALIRTLTGSTIFDELNRGYIALATKYLEHQGGITALCDSRDPCSLDAAVCETAQPIDLRELRKEYEIIETDNERPGELFDNLGHIFVLIQSITILHNTFSFTPKFCAPTQQSEHEGRRIHDLEGENWFLEAFGGTDISNNSKIAKDLKSLSNGKSEKQRTFFSFRTSSWNATQKWNKNEIKAICRKCAPSHGEEFRVNANLEIVDRLNGVTVLEAKQIIVFDIKTTKIAEPAH